MGGSFYLNLIIDTLQQGYKAIFILHRYREGDSFSVNQPDLPLTNLFDGLKLRDIKPLSPYFQGDNSLICVNDQLLEDKVRSSERHYKCKCHQQKGAYIVTDIEQQNQHQNSHTAVYGQCVTDELILLIENRMELFHQIDSFK